MQYSSEPKTSGRRSGLKHVLGIGVLCAAVLGAAALAQSQQPDPEPEAKSEAKPKPEAAPTAEPSTEAGPKDATGGDPKSEVKPEKTPRPKLDPRSRATRAKSKAKGKAKPGRSKRGRRSPKFEMDPNAKWACDQQTVSLDPVWRGNKNLTFNFNIRNQGTADLKIRARGG